MNDTIQVRFTLNGRPCEAMVPPETTLLKLLRDHLRLTGTKCGCEIGECGACTVILDGRTVNSCLVLAGQVEGATVETVEALAVNQPAVGPEDLHPLQKAFLDEDAVSCGFCTPGMLMSAKALLADRPRPTEDEVRLALSGTLCRCTGYIPIVRAVLKAAEAMGSEEET